MPRSPECDDKLREVYKRLSQLDEETQAHISKKFYHGKRPWLTRSETSQRRQTKDRQQEQE